MVDSLQEGHLRSFLPQLRSGSIRHVVAPQFVAAVVVRLRCRSEDDFLVVQDLDRCVVPDRGSRDSVGLTGATPSVPSDKEKKWCEGRWTSVIDRLESEERCGDGPANPVARQGIGRIDLASPRRERNHIRVFHRVLPLKELRAKCPIDLKSGFVTGSLP